MKGFERARRVGKNGRARFLPQARRARGERDPYLFVLVGQTALCALVLLCMLAARQARPPGWETVSSGYLELLSERMDTFLQERLSVEDAVRWYAGWREEASQVVADTVRRLTADRESPPDMGEGQAVSGEADDAQVSASVLDGAGGLWKAQAEEARAAPDGAAFSRILLTNIVVPPVSGVLTSPYGWREHPITQNADFHGGVDIAAPAGTGIRAPMGGRVAETGTSDIYGNYVALDHGSGLRTMYCHCSEIVVQEGENLRKGELLALVGSTGVSTGPHVHFEISKDSTRYDPAWVMDGLEKDGV